MSEGELNAYATLGARAARAALVDLQLGGCGGGLGGGGGLTVHAGAGAASSSSVCVQAVRSLAEDLRHAGRGAGGPMEPLSPKSLVLVSDSAGHAAPQPPVARSSVLMSSGLTMSSSLDSFSPDSSAGLVGSDWGMLGGQSEGSCAGDHPPLYCPVGTRNGPHREMPSLSRVPPLSAAAARDHPHAAPHVLPSATATGEAAQAERAGASEGRGRTAQERETYVLNSCSGAGSSYAFVSSTGAVPSVAGTSFSTATSCSFSYAGNSTTASAEGGAGSKSAASSCTSARKLETGSVD